MQEALNFATLSDGGSEPGTPAPQHAPPADLGNRSVGPITFPYNSMQTPSTATTESSPESRVSAFS